MGKPSRDKGARRERELVLLFKAWGLRAERVPLSGAARYQGGCHDVDVYKCSRDAPLAGEVKARKKFPTYLTEWLAENDYVALKGDREEWLFILPERVMRELLVQ